MFGHFISIKGIPHKLSSSHSDSLECNFNLELQIDPATSVCENIVALLSAMEQEGLPYLYDK
jgi:hypothetical protein